jgi:hypothetical protein
MRSHNTIQHSIKVRQEMALLQVSFFFLLAQVALVACKEEQVDSERKMEMYRYHHIYPPEEDTSNVQNSTSNDNGKRHRSIRMARKAYGRFPASVALPGKKGIGLSMIEPEEGKTGSWVENLPKVEALTVRWNYAWSPKRPEQQPSRIEFVSSIE